MARRNKIKRGISGGVRPDDLPAPRLSFRERQQRRQAYNQRVREINQRRRERAGRLNAQRRAAARSDFRERTTSPDYASNENYQRALSDNQDRFNQTQSALDEQEAGLGVAYGLGQFGGDIASNPYSRAAMLQRSYNQNQRASLNTMASRGQLYSGATQNQANANVSNYGSAYDALSKDFGSRLSQIGIQRQDASDRFRAANETASRKAVDEASRLFPVTRENAPRFQPPKLVQPKFKKFRPPLRRPPRPNRPNRPNRPGPSGGVRP